MRSDDGGADYEKAWGVRGASVAGIADHYPRVLRFHGEINAAGIGGKLLHSSQYHPSLWKQPKMII